MHVMAKGTFSAMIVSIFLVVFLGGQDKGIIEVQKEKVETCMVTEGENQLKCLDNNDVINLELGRNVDIDVETGTVLYSDRRTMPEVREIEIGEIDNINEVVQLSTEDIKSILGVYTEDTDKYMSKSTDISEWGYFVEYDSDKGKVKIVDNKDNKIPIRYNNREKNKKFEDNDLKDPNYTVRKELGSTYIMVTMGEFSEISGIKRVESVYVDDKGDLVIRLVDKSSGGIHSDLGLTAFYQPKWYIEVPYNVKSSIKIKDNKDRVYKYIE